MEERLQSRLRARARKETRTPEEKVTYLKGHREAQARYRLSRRKELAWKAREYRYDF